MKLKSKVCFYVLCTIFKRKCGLTRGECSLKCLSIFLAEVTIIRHITENAKTLSTIPSTQSTKVSKETEGTFQTEQFPSTCHF